jgi:hypothetical protein
MRNSKGRSIQSSFEACYLRKWKNGGGKRMKLRLIVDDSKMALKYRIDRGVFSPVSNYNGKQFRVKGDILEISGGINKKVKVDISKYTKDIDVHLCSFKTMNKGRVFAIVVESGQKVDIY